MQNRVPGLIEHGKGTGQSGMLFLLLMFVIIGMSLRVC